MLPTVAGNVISHPSIVLPRLPAGSGWLGAGPTGEALSRAPPPPAHSSKVTPLSESHPQSIGVESRVAGREMYAPLFIRKVNDLNKTGKLSRFRRPPANLLSVVKVNRATGCYFRVVPLCIPMFRLASAPPLVGLALC